MQKVKDWFKKLWGVVISIWELFTYLILIVIVLAILAVFFQFYCMPKIRHAIESNPPVVIQAESKAAVSVKNEQCKVKKSAEIKKVSVEKESSIDDLEINCLIVYNQDKKDRKIWINGRKEIVSPGRRKFAGSPSGNTAVWTKENKVTPFNLNSYDRKVKIMYIEDGKIS